jgi:hypothetical protein
MKALFCALFINIALYSNAVAADWREITPGRYIDASTMHTLKNEIRNYWVWYLLPKETVELLSKAYPKYLEYGHDVASHDIDCNNRMIRSTYGVSYTTKGLTIHSDYANNKKYAPIVPGSNGEFEYNFVCNNKTVTGRPPSPKESSDISNRKAPVSDEEALEQIRTFPGSEGPVNTGHRGRVLETMDSGGYTFARIDENSKKLWVAVMQTKVKIGDMVEFSDSPPLVNFHSNTLKRTFAKILFAPDLHVEMNKEWSTANSQFAKHYPEIVSNPALLAQANRLYYAKIAEGKSISQAMREAGFEVTYSMAVNHRTKSTVN